MVRFRVICSDGVDRCGQSFATQQAAWSFQAMRHVQCPAGHRHNVTREATVVVPVRENRTVAA